MQNRYTGDIGDFSKLALLRVLHNSGFSIGLNWFLVPDENHNEDGKHTRYLQQSERYRTLDPQLFDELKIIVDSKNRIVAAMEKPEILEAVFFSEQLNCISESDRVKFRLAWHERALNTINGLDIVCLDPDNGILVPSAMKTRREIKYARPEEISDYFKQGSSVICYQHKARKKDEFYQKQFAVLVDSISGARGAALKFKTTSQRYYLFILQAKHENSVREAIQNMLNTEWRSYFEIISI